MLALHVPHRIPMHVAALQTDFFYSGCRSLPFLIILLAQPACLMVHSLSGVPLCLVPLAYLANWSLPTLCAGLEILFQAYVLIHLLCFAENTKRYSFCY